MNMTHLRRARLAAASCATLTALTLAAAGATAATAGAATARAGPGGAPIVRTDDRAVRGMTAGTVDEFLGLPYAAPPRGTCGGAPRSPRVSGRGSVTPPSSRRAAHSRRPPDSPGGRGAPGVSRDVCGLAAVVFGCLVAGQGNGQALARDRYGSNAPSRGAIVRRQQL